MDIIQNVGQLAKIGTEAVESKESVPGKKAGETSDFEKVRMEKIDGPDPSQSVETQKIEFNDNILSRSDVKSSQADFLHQVQQRGEGSELKILSEHIDGVKTRLDQVQQSVQGANKPELKDALSGFFGKFESNIGKMDDIMKQLSSGDRQFSQQDLLKIQTQIHTLSENMEMISKIVDHATQGLKTILQTQV